jgi:hypothetical protein
MNLLPVIAVTFSESSGGKADTIRSVGLGSNRPDAALLTLNADAGGLAVIGGKGRKGGAGGTGNAPKANLATLGVASEL